MANGDVSIQLNVLSETSSWIRKFSNRESKIFPRNYVKYLHDDQWHSVHVEKNYNMTRIRDHDFYGTERSTFFVKSMYLLKEVTKELISQNFFSKIVFYIAVETREIHIPCKFFFVKSIYSTFFSKTLIWRKFCEKNRGSEIP